MLNSLVLLSLAGLMVGVSQVINKKISASGYSSKTYTTVIMLVNAVVSIPLLFYNFSLASRPTTWIIILFSVVIYAFSTHFNFQAYKLADISTVAIIQRTSLIFVAIIGIFFFKESYSLLAYIGLGLIFLSSLTLSYKGNHLVFNRGVIYAFLAAITGAVVSVLDKAVLRDFSPYTYVFVNNFLVGLIFAFNVSRLKEARALIKKDYASVIATALLWTGAFLLVSLVLQKADVSRTIPVYKSLGLIIPVVMGIIFLGERQMIKEKLLGLLLGTIGIVMLYWF